MYMPKLTTELVDKQSPLLALRFNFICRACSVHNKICKVQTKKPLKLFPTRNITVCNEHQLNR